MGPVVLLNDLFLGWVGNSAHEEQRASGLLVDDEDEGSVEGQSWRRR